MLAAREDIALREASEEALRLTQFSIDQSTVGILWVNWDSHVRYANRAAETMLGYPAGGIIDRPLIDFEPGLHMDRWLSLWKRARASEEGPQSFETNCVRADGSILPADVSLSFLRFRDGEYLVVYLNDVTERRRALAALQESEARLQGIAANVPGLVFRLERAPVTGQIDFAYISEGSESLVGYSPATLAHRDKGLRSLVHPDDKASYHQTQDHALDTDSDWSWQGRILTRQGEQRWAEIKAITRRLEDGAYVWDGIVWDITESKRIELELASSREQLRELSAHLESVREEEKGAHRPGSSRRVGSDVDRAKAGNIHVRTGLRPARPGPARALEQHEALDRSTVSTGAGCGHGATAADSRCRDRLGHRVAGAAVRGAHADPVSGASAG